MASLRAGDKIIFAGNGGSFADAQHLSAEFTSRFLFDRAPLASLAQPPTARPSAQLATTMDTNRSSRGNFRPPDDVFIPISTSGNSANILAAVSVAKELGVTTVAWTGAGGGRLGQMCDCI